MGGLTSSVAMALRAAPQRILVTGAGGWLGRATLDLLRDALGADFHDRVRCFGSKRRILDVCGSETIVQDPLAALADLDTIPSLLLHFAFLTKDRADRMDEAHYRDANEAIRTTVVGVADQAGVDAAFVASSGAAALADAPNASAGMRLYGSLKRDDEEAFATWAKMKDKRLVVARIHNLSGPHINKHETYALASFIRDAQRGGPITIRAAHDVVRGYVAVRELMSLVFALLLREDVGIVRFDTGGEPIELGALAHAVAAELGCAAVERPARMAGEDRYLGANAHYQALLNSQGIEQVSLAQQIAETAEFLLKNVAQ